MQQVIIRPMEKKDVIRVHEIECASFPTPWSVSSFQSELVNVCACYLVIEEDGVIMGYGGMWMIVGEAHITNVAVMPEARGKGYGEMLVRGLMQEAYDRLGITEMTLEVRRGNTVAQGLYAKLGFQVEGIRAKYYENNHEDAFIMWCHDTKPYIRIEDEE